MSKTFVLLVILFEMSFSYKLKQNDVFTNWHIGQRSTTRGSGPLAESKLIWKTVLKKYFIPFDV